MGEAEFEGQYDPDGQTDGVVDPIGQKVPPSHTMEDEVLTQ
jgi:hypothetical protein